MEGDLGVRQLAQLRVRQLAELRPPGMCQRPPRQSERRKPLQHVDGDHLPECVRNAGGTPQQHRPASSGGSSASAMRRWRRGVWLQEGVTCE